MAIPRILSIPQTPQMKAQSHCGGTRGLCSSSALTGMLFGNGDIFFSILQRKQGSKPALCCDRGSLSLLLRAEL